MSLHIGTTIPGGKPFHLQDDLSDVKLAMLAQSKKGKTYGLGVILEELVTSSAGSAADRGPFLKWLEKAPKVGMKTMLEHLLENGSATRQQLATIAGVARSTAYDYVGWILRNQLAEDTGGRIVLRPVH